MGFGCCFIFCNQYSIFNLNNWLSVSLVGYSSCFCCTLSCDRVKHVH
nr:MAG TPA: hypothetical protein [Caudoviricetes sp.]